MAAAGERHLRRAAPSAPATGFTNYEARKPPVNSQNLPLLLKQNFKRLVTPLQPPRTSLAHPLRKSPKYGYFQTFDFSPQTSRCDTPLQTRKSKAIAKEFLTDLPSPSFCNSPDAACSAHSGNRQNTGVFPKSPILFPKPAMRHNGRKTRRAQTALTPLTRDCPRQYFYSLPNGKRISRERFAITRTELRRQGSASLKICNGQKGAHGAGGDGAPTPDTAGNRLCQNAKYKKAPAPRRPSAGNSAFRRNRRACKKKRTPREVRFWQILSRIGRPAQQPPRWTCLSIVGAPLPMGAYAAYASGAAS